MGKFLLHHHSASPVMLRCTRFLCQFRVKGTLQRYLSRLKALLTFKMLLFYLFHLVSSADSSQVRSRFRWSCLFTHHNLLHLLHWRLSWPQKHAPSLLVLLHAQLIVLSCQLFDILARDRSKSCLVLVDLLDCGALVCRVISGLRICHFLWFDHGAIR